MLALAEALGWPFEVKRLVYRKTELATNLALGPTLAGMVRSQSSPLAEPWPDLVISAGRRNEPVARWIRQRSGGRARLVHFGRPWARTECFDLVITTPQYAVPPRPNILWLDLPLHRVTPERLEQAAEAWRERLAHLPQPRIAVLVGGDSAPYRLGLDAAGRLGRTVARMAKDAGGSLLVTTSARTGAEASEALREAIDGPVYIHYWDPRAQENPYLAFLALADAIVVTGDSVSMVAEACATKAPVYVFDPGEGPSSMREPTGPRSARDVVRNLDGWTLFYRTVHRLAPVRMRRNIGAMLRALVESGRAAWLGDPAPPSRRGRSTDLPRAVERVRSLFAESVVPAGHAVPQSARSDHESHPER
jgi:mitochondrial fission protein ELM1